ncbi:PREDICTED: inactive GDSL esterase/lipase-like protein 25 [Tarenaya hassleriana]|uniref:inactive GDSL esterase/lipase-like protein 25 n=1 Tax=Tarenaya hassleriana TaxID=28532 RepID=UPI00053C1EDC|nr:PREDICTED: inactive GDSL esterase/lipase-like protein 25 [Tarenaya hassleriana]
MADQLSRFFFFLLSSLVFTLSLLQHPTACRAQTLFVFGDGFYDVGNKQFLSGNLVSANAPPYGVTVGKATGRWSDGLVVSDYLAGFMGIPRISPILDPRSDLSHGASFAIAGATVLGSPPETMTLGQQVRKFSENKNKWTDDERSKAIYLFYIGGDDYLNFAKKNPNPSDDQKQALSDQIITGIEAAIKAVYGDGGRKFALQNLAPLGCLPAVKQENGEGDTCVKLPSELAALHNKKLLQLLRKLGLKLKGFQYSYYDFFRCRQFNMYIYILENASGVHRVKMICDVGTAFEKGNAACCGKGAYNGTGCGTDTVCSKPPEYVFFDGKHLTNEANFQIGQLIWSSDTEVISPNNLRELLVLPLDIPVIFNTASNTTGSGEEEEDTRREIHKMYDMGSLEWGTENQWPYQLDSVRSFTG